MSGTPLSRIAGYVLAVIPMLFFISLILGLIFKPPSRFFYLSSVLFVLCGLLLLIVVILWIVHFLTSRS